MTKDELVRLVRDELRLPLAPHGGEPDADQVLNWRSVDLVRLVLAVQRRTGRKLPIGELHERCTLRRLHALCSAEEKAAARPADGPPTRDLYSWFTRSAARNPDDLAVRVAGVDLSYAELGRDAARTAGEILERHGGRPRRVALLASRSPGTYVGYLAGLHLGACVVLLNSEFPHERNAQIMEAADVDLVLGPPEDAAAVAELSASTGTPHATVTVGPPSAGPEPAPVHRPDAEDLAYVIFTSGSTGAPKGVPIKHRHISTWLEYCVPYFEGGPGTRFSQTADLSWDLSVWVLFIAWASGGAVVVPTKGELLTPVRHITEDRITHFFSVPSVISMARTLGDLAPGSMPLLRWSLFGGEPLTVENARAWWEAAPQGTLANVYGPTELTVTCTTYRLPARPDRWPATPHGSLPIGPAHPAIEWTVVDGDGERSPEGELLVRGAQRFDGYLNPQHNHGRFALWGGPEGYRVYDGEGPLTRAHWYRTGDRVREENGTFVYVGRLDDQVKIHGYRAEPGDVEAAMRRHPEVDEAVVVPCATEDGAVELTGFHLGRTADTRHLTDFLSQQLPAYLVPRYTVHLEEFPLNFNGKVDRKKLSAYAAELAGGKGSGREEAPESGLV